MNKTIYIHIGPPKTGSTTIQAMLDKSREELLGQGILYPTSGRPIFGEKYWVSRPQGRVFFLAPMSAHHFLAWTVLGKVEGLESDQCWKPLLEEIKESDAHTVVLSSEDFSKMSVRHIKRVESYLNGYEVKVIIYLREPFSRILSDYTQNVKKGRFSRSFEEYIRQPKSKLLPYEDIISQWEHVFGAQNICVNVIGKVKEKFNLEKQFIRNLGENPKNYEGIYNKEVVNPSPMPDIVRLLIIINKFEQSLGYSEKIRSIFERIRKYLITRGYISELIKKFRGELAVKSLYTKEDRQYVEELFGMHYRALLEKYSGTESVGDSEIKRHII